MSETTGQREPPKVLAIITDLIFSTKIFSTAGTLGVAVAGARTPAAVDRAFDGGGVALVLLDLNATGLDPLAIIGTLRRRPAPPRIVAFLSHVQAELAAAARAAGADEVLARSAFSQRLPEILRSALP